MYIALMLMHVALSPNFQRGYADHSRQLRSDLLAAYDRFVPPKSSRGLVVSEAGTDVELSIKFFKVKEVDASKGSMELKVWLRMYWKDERLSWDPVQYGGITRTRNLMHRIRKRSRERERLAERQAVRELANDLSIRVSRTPGARGGVGE